MTLCTVIGFGVAFNTKPATYLVLPHVQEKNPQSPLLNPQEITLLRPGGCKQHPQHDEGDHHIDPIPLQREGSHGKGDHRKGDPYDHPAAHAGQGSQKPGQRGPDKDQGVNSTTFMDSISR